MTSPRGTERRQFALLVRSSVGRLMDTALASRETDAEQFALWGVALMAAPPLFFGMKMMGRYNFLGMTRRTALLEQAALADRLFFIIWSMLAAALLAAVMWEALFPDRQDQEIVGVLPVRPRTLAAARWSAATGVALAYSVAVALPGGVMYTLAVASAWKHSALIGWWPTVFVSHLTATTMAALFTFSALLAIRGLAVLVVGATIAARAAALLQLLTIVTLVEVFIFLPGVLERVVREVMSTGITPEVAWLPPTWFLAVYAAFSGPRSEAFGALAPTAWEATGCALASAALVYVVPATLNARRAIEARLQDRAGRLVPAARWIGALVLRRPTSRAVFGFVIASLVRSRNHALTIATYLGVAVALAGIRFMSATIVRRRGRSLVGEQLVSLDVPADVLLALPLVLTFFLVFGLRAAFAKPTDVEANWTFRLIQPRSTAPCVAAIGAAFTFVAVLPVTAAWLLVALSLWDVWTALGVAVMHAASGVALVELVLIGVRTVPFTCGYAPSSNAVRIGWAYFLVALHLYAFRLDDLQLAAIDSMWGVTIYVAAMLAVVAFARLYRRAKRPSWTLNFDAPVEHSVERLNLSPALG